jgi:hypothetical protein
MENIHNFIVRHNKFIIVVFVLSSFVFQKQNCNFSIIAMQEFEEEYLAGRTIRPQFFTYEALWGKINHPDWKHWTEHIKSNPAFDKINKTIFIIDDIWAFFLIGMIYLLSNIRNKAFHTLKSALLFLLLIAYGLDFVENKVYFNLYEDGFLVDNLPIIGTLKMAFYLIALVLALFLFIKMKPSNH